MKKNPKKLLKRMDKDIDQYRLIGENPKNYTKMVKAVYQELKDPSKYEAKRLSKAIDICGKIDGKVSQRVVAIIKELCEK